MKVKEFAERERISVQRATRLVREGRVPATRKGRTWVVADDAVLERRDRRPLSPQSREDFLKFLNTHTFDGIPGNRKKRTAQRVRKFIESEDPATLLSTWWGNETPEGRGGAVIVRAAKKRREQPVRDAQRGMGVWILDNPRDIAGRVSDWRAIRGATVDEVAERAGVPREVVTTIERTGRSPRGNRDAARIVKALRIPAIEIRSEKGQS